MPAMPEQNFRSKLEFQMSQRAVDRPKLSLGLKRDPLALEAYKAKLKIVEPVTIASRPVAEPEEVSVSNPHSPAAPASFVLITGEPAPPDPRDAKPRTAAQRKEELERWIVGVGVAVRRSFPAGSREGKAAVEFAKSHRLSIANAFQRRIKRDDVVAELLRMYQTEIQSNSDVSG